MSNDIQSTNFWWVNQGQTYADELRLGVLWAPIATSEGRRFGHWDALDEASIGDLVFHYANGYLRAISVVQLSSRPAKTPFDNRPWDDAGREVRTTYFELDVPIPLASIPESVRLAKSYAGSPFDRNGDVKQGYFFGLSGRDGMELLEHLGLDDVSTDVTGSDSATVDVRLLGDGPTDATRIRKIRLEQRAIRLLLLKGSLQSECAICGETYPSNLLAAAHIKPRYACSESERRDLAVIMAACLFGCDALYEGGLIHVDSMGLVQQTRGSTTTAPVSSRIGAIAGRQVSAYSQKSAKYFAWHRTHVAGVK